MSCRYRNVLHKNHYLVLSAKHSLCQLYGRSEGHLIQDMSLECLKRKEEYCRELLQVVNHLEPGLTRLRGGFHLFLGIMMIIWKDISISRLNHVWVTCADHDTGHETIRRQGNWLEGVTEAAEGGAEPLEAQRTDIILWARGHIREYDGPGRPGCHQTNRKCLMG